jgi:hypothetical protein
MPGRSNWSPSGRLLAGAFFGWLDWRDTMKRSEILFWAAAVAIAVFSGVVAVVTSHNRHHGGSVTPSTQDRSAAPASAG